jgi:hypothetical protein
MKYLIPVEFGEKHQYFRVFQKMILYYSKLYVVNYQVFTAAKKSDAANIQKESMFSIS